MKVLLLAGGSSREREVSLSSGNAVLAALNRLGHSVLTLDPATGQSFIDENGKQLTSDDNQSGSSLLSSSPDSKRAINLFAGEEFSDVEIVFIALHGGEGEDGTIQAMLDLSGKRYTGSGMAASAVSMDKAMAKRLFSSIGIKTPNWKLHVLEDGQSFLRQVAKDVDASFSYPVIVKPNDGGSTVALTKVSSNNELAKAIELAFSESANVLVEEFIAGRELTVTVLSGRSFPVVEIKPKSGLYDYEAKYTPGKTDYVAPAQIDEKLSTEIRLAAVEAFRVVGASGLARIDFILDVNGKFHILELNSLPGMTELSLAPMAAKCEGIEFDQFVQLILEDALRGDL